MMIKKMMMEKMIKVTKVIKMEKRMARKIEKRIVFS